MRKPTYDELEGGLRSFAFRVNFHRTMSMDNQAVLNDLADLDAYVQAHSSHNGEYPQKYIDARVNEAFWLRIAKMTPPVKMPSEPKVVKERKPRKKKDAV